MRLKMQFSHFDKHKFSHGFSDKINRICIFRNEVETTEHFLLRFIFTVLEDYNFLKFLSKLTEIF